MQCSAVLLNHQSAVEMPRVWDNFSSVLSARSPWLGMESVFTDGSVKSLEELMFTPLRKCVLLIKLILLTELGVDSTDKACSRCYALHVF